MNSTFFKKLLIILLIVLGVFFRFYNLNWGSPFYFHPDERNIAYLLATPLKMDIFFKGTFAYGNFLIITGAATRTILTPLFNTLHIFDSFTESIIILRSFSLLASLGVLFFLYKTGALWSRKAGIFALLLGLFSTGLIQQSHYGTFDLFITCFALISFYCILRYKKSSSVFWYYLTLVSVAVGSSAKITLIILCIFPFFMFLFSKRKFLSKAIHILSGILISIIVPFTLSPYYLTKDFFSGILYEQGVVNGSISVFYTQSFQHTTGVIFQLLHIYPSLLNPFVEVIFLLTFFYTLFLIFRTKNSALLLLFFYFLLLFLPQAFLFAKWTRYMLPTVPFIYLFIAVGFESGVKSLTKQKTVYSFLVGIITIICFIYAYAYVHTAFFNTDTRVQASVFATQNISEKSGILTEPYDLGILPFQSYFQHIQDFPLYDIDSNPTLQSQFAQILTKTDVIILPSQRLFRSRLSDPTAFPSGYTFYTKLNNNLLGFKKIYQTPCDVWCSLVYIGNPIFSYEETASVFDRPTVFIFKKTRNYSASEYKNLLE